MTTQGVTVPLGLFLAHALGCIHIVLVLPLFKWTLKGTVTFSCRFFYLLFQFTFRLTRLSLPELP